MATLTSSDNDPISLYCQLCEKTYQHKSGPLMLPCLHSFCKPCLEQYIRKENRAPDGQKMACPTCHDPFPIPDDVNALPLNLRLSHLAKSSLYQNKMEGNEMDCQKCEEDAQKAIVFCCKCCEFLCKKCKHYHQMFLRDEDHEFIELDKYEKSEFKIHPPPAKCPFHKKEELTFFCEEPECEKLTCHKCCLITHKDHRLSYLDQMSEKEGSELQEMANNVDSALDTLDSTLQQIQEMQENVAVSAKEASNRITQACKELIQAVEKRRDDLLQDCHKIEQEKIDVLSNQFNELERLRNNLRFAKLHANDAIKNHTPEEILSVKKTIKQRIRRMTELYERQSMDLKEDDTINTSLEIEFLLREIEGVGFFPGVPKPSKCSVEGLAVPFAGVGKERQMAVVLNDEKGEPVQGELNLQYQLRKLGEDPDAYIPPKVTVTKSDKVDGVAILTFTPNQPGEYEMTIMVRNKPFNPCVITARPSQDYTKFSDKSFSYASLNGGSYHGIAVHDNGTMYVSDRSNHTIRVLKPDGNKEQIGNSSNDGGNLDDPRGLMILDDILYVVNEDGHSINKYSLDDGKLIKKIGNGQGNGDDQFNYPYGVCTDGKGRVLVADRCNKRIKILTADSEFISSFRCNREPWDVAVDPVGNVHVALRDNHCIGVYSQNGNEIGTYNFDGRLRYPSGIYVDGEGNRLITSYDNNEVHIADVNDTLLSTKGYSRAFMSTMNNNGTVLIADCNNNRIATVVN